MHRRTLAGLTTATLTGGLLLPLTSTAATTDWAPPRAGQGHPRAMVTLASGTTIALGDWGWVTRRAAGASSWSPARHELVDLDRRARLSPHRVADSGNSLIASYFAPNDVDTHHLTYVWRPATGWSRAVTDRGPVWAGVKGVVGIGRKRYLPDRGWTTLPRIPLHPVAMAGDAAGRVTAVGRREGRLSVTRFIPGAGWARPDRITRGQHPELAVTPRGDRAILVGRKDRLVLLRSLRDRDWRRFVVAEGLTIEQHVQLDRRGRVSVVWRRERPTASNPFYARRLRANGHWEQRLWLGNDLYNMAVAGTNAGQLAVAYRRPGVGNGPTYVRTRTPAGAWASEVRVSDHGDFFGLAMSPDGCVTGYAFSFRIGRFTARTRGSCAGIEPEPADPRTPWQPLVSPAGAEAYVPSNIRVARTTDGHMLLAWTSGNGSVRAAERTGSGFSHETTLSPSGVEDCDIKALDAVGSTVQTVLECHASEEPYELRWFERSWSGAAGWGLVRRLPTDNLDNPDLDVDVSDQGPTAVVIGYWFEERPSIVRYRPTPDADWQELPLPPAFDGTFTEWAVHVTEAGDIIVANDFGRQYAVYRQSTGSWSPVDEVPLPAAYSGYEWEVSDVGRILVSLHTEDADHFAVRDPDGEWSGPYALPGGDRCRDLALADDKITVIETAGQCTSDEVSLGTRDFDIATATWSATTVLGTGGGPREPTLSGNADGDLLVQWAHETQFGLDRPDSLWRRPAGLASWSGPEYVPAGYDLEPIVLPDGTLATTVPFRTTEPGAWLSLPD